MINYSFIIPHKNCPKLLTRCVDSIPLRPDIEIIVVDDNSDEDKKPVLPERRGMQLIQLNADESNGAGRARNVGLDHSNGKWLVFADSDDFFAEHLPDFLDEYSDDVSHDIIFFDIKHCDCYDTSKVVMGYNKSGLFQKSKERNNDIYLRFGYTEPWGKFYRRRMIIEKGIRFQETKAHNDLLFSVKAGLLAGNVMADGRVMYWYVYRKGSIGHSEEPFDKICDRIRAWYNTQLFLSEQGLETMLYLPIKPCNKVLFTRHDVITFLRLIKFMNKNNMGTARVIRDMMRYFFMNVFTKNDLGLSAMITAESAQSWKINHDNIVMNG